MRKTDKFLRRLRITFLMFSAILLSGTIALGQVTTSSMSGKVSSSSGETLPGATVIATHTPSGTNYGTISNAEGRFNLNGMRVGGPYTVEVTFIGYGAFTQSNITLSLGENSLVSTKF
ncbi:protein containing carboxypeptidase regulatory-like domain [Lentimicrobium saccharophilum]|uniref:Protein containing carboxypeptidase regulatory-like domain n=1 Tax=Lentimicrobium saccharophilum TaxID=1678841 RepID=A0A0S7C204_9BACT|nr:carboxypeptidase-like regulatory domain-containing protein [Lentimicrobium saccharophilum]GAP43177.1 protein containing carboxypeptidase regulatory-like domain [Lentimicrobium saccharophilum]